MEPNEISGTVYDKKLSIQEPGKRFDELYNERGINGFSVRIKMDLSKLTPEQKKSLFCQLYKEFDTGSSSSEDDIQPCLPPPVPNSPNDLTTSTIIAPKRRGPKPGSTPKSKESQFKRAIEDGLHTKVYNDFRNRMKKADLKEKYNISDYMVGKLIAYAKQHSSSESMSPIIEAKEEVKVEA